MSTTSIDSLLHEERRFAPDPDFTASAVAGPELYERASADRLGFWADQARELHWHTPFTQTLDWSDPPFARWFHDGELNVAYNCLDRHVAAGIGDRVAIHWEGEPGDSRSITYAELTREVKRAANMLAGLGIGQGDRVAIYLPVIPEAVIAMLAVARLGAIHSVIFGGFSAESIRARVEDADATLVITADGGWRKGKVFPLKGAVDAALAAGALLVAHAHWPEACEALLTDKAQRLRLCGYGRVEESALTRSTEQDVTLVSTETLPDRCHHFYEVPMPEDFLAGRSRTREITVALAHSPAVRTTRLGYKSCEMEFRLVWADDLTRMTRMFNAATSKEDYQRIPEANGARIGAKNRGAGTVQADTWTLKRITSQRRELRLFVVVTRSDEAWGRDLTLTEEPYALAVVLRDRENAEARLYTQLQARLRARIQARVRA